MNKVVNNSKDRINKDKLIERLQCAIDAENTISICYNRLTSLIKNGRVRDRFRIFSDEAKTDKQLLINHLQSFGVNDVVQENKCTSCKINPEVFLQSERSIWDWKLQKQQQNFIRNC